jgi:hypothetical protein
MIRKVQKRLRSDCCAEHAVYQSKAKLADLGAFASPGTPILLGKL